MDMYAYLASIEDLLDSAHDELRKDEFMWLIEELKDLIYQFD